MKVVVLFLAFFAVAYGNPWANSKVWRWKSRMPTVTPNVKAGFYPEIAVPPKQLIRVPGTWRAVSCGPTSSVTPAVVNGQEAIPHSYPWQVALFIDDIAFCGGTLISDEWVLTAGHCSTGAQRIEVVLGAHNLKVHEPTQVTINSTDIITHEDFKPYRLLNDVGLVHLASPVQFTSAIQPACLPSYSDSDLGGGIMLTATGWGKTTDHHHGNISETLNQVTDPSITNEECEQMYQLHLSPATICTSTTDGKKGTCNGDSGGPLNYVYGGKTYSRGVTSFVSSAGCSSGYPDGFTRTSHFLEWIETHTGIAID